MAYLNDFIRIDIIGDCYDSAEIWNTGFKLKVDGLGSIDQNTLMTVSEGVADEWKLFFEGTGEDEGMAFSTRYRTKEVKASHVGTDGKVIGNTYTYFYEPIVGGRSGAENPLPQAAIVASLRSSKQRGPASQGRMYLPGLIYTVGTDALMPEEEVREVANDFNAFVNGVNNIGGTVGTEYTVILTSPVGDGHEMPVTQTGMDRKVDTQRRRANALTSDYLTNEVI